jgi:hypothetical protein
MIETQATIDEWRVATFGTGSTLRAAIRANEEMAELLRCLADPCARSGSGIRMRPGDVRWYKLVLVEE